MLKATGTLFGKELSSDEVKIWVDFLKPFSLAELRYAFDHWNKNARFFPKPKDIQELVDAFRLSSANAKPIRYEHYGEGYGAQDMIWLFHKYQAQRAQQTRPLTRVQIFRLLDELDQVRGSAPEWRKSA